MERYSDVSDQVRDVMTISDGLDKPIKMLKAHS